MRLVGWEPDHVAGGQFRVSKVDILNSSQHLLFIAVPRFNRLCHSLDPSCCVELGEISVSYSDDVVPHQAFLALDRGEKPFKAAACGEEADRPSFAVGDPDTVQHLLKIGRASCRE